MLLTGLIKLCPCAPGVLLRLFTVLNNFSTDYFVRFRVIIEMMKPDKPDSATTLKGLDYIDVPGLSKREYKLNFFAHKEGTFSAKVRNMAQICGVFYCIESCFFQTCVLLRT